MIFYFIFAYAITIFGIFTYMQTEAYRKETQKSYSDVNIFLVLTGVFSFVSLPLIVIGYLIWKSAKLFYSRFLAPRD